MAVSVLYESGNQGKRLYASGACCGLRTRNLGACRAWFAGSRGGGQAAARDYLRAALQQRHRLSGNRVVRLDYRTRVGRARQLSAIL